VFVAAVLVAHLAGADPDRSAAAALVFVAARILHPIFYIANLDLLRSSTFAVGFGSCLYLFALAAGA
jgi:uncharacterized MAPEG superfamily protein